MSGVMPQLLLVAFLTVVNALFAGSEMALVSLRESRVQQLERESKRGKVLAALVAEPNRFLATIQVGITLANFFSSATAAVALAQPLQQRFGLPPTLSISIITVGLAYLTLVLGELAPKRVAMQRAEGWSLFMAYPLTWISVLTRPIVWFLARSTDVAVRVFGIDPRATDEQVSEQELRDMVAQQKGFSPDQRTIIAGAFDIADREVGEVMRPRRDVIVLRSDLSCSEALSLLVESGHSRAPVAPGGMLDEILGIVHLRDLYSGGTALSAGQVATEAVALPESATVVDAMRALQAQHAQMALVVDEHGAAEGIVTLEDLLEEIVGEIYDETDRDVAGAQRLPDGSIVLPGSFPIHDLPDLHLALPDGPYATVAGYLLERLGRVPEGPGDAVEAEGLRFEVLATDRRAITEVKVVSLSDDHSPQEE